MKTILTFITVLCLAISTQAGLVTTVLNGGTNNVSLNTTNYYNNGVLPVVSLPATFASRNSLQLTYKMNLPSNTVCFYSFDNSLDNVNWSTNVLSGGLASQGLSQSTTNIELSTGVPFWRLGYFGSTNVAACPTNIIANIFNKTGL